MNPGFRPRYIALLIIFVTLFAPISFADWGPYKSVSDGQNDKIKMRVSIDPFHFSADTRKMTYQFRNDYSSRVTFSFKVYYYDDKSMRLSSSGEESLAPGKESTWAGAV